MIRAERVTKPCETCGKLITNRVSRNQRYCSHSCKSKGKVRKRNTPEDFWAKVDKTNVDGCWNWVGNTVPSGYGTIKFGGKSISTHRFSYELTKGKIPEGMVIRHMCNNRLCCNPNHLEVGTSQDNSDDMVKANRSLKGEKNYKSKLTPQQVLDMRKLYQEGRLTQPELAEIYKITQSSVSSIILRKHWSHI